MDITKQVQTWYENNVVHWTGLLSANLSIDSRRGGVAINVETDLMLASIMFWNKGEAEVSAIHKLLNRDMLLEYRELSPADQVPLLLDRYFESIVTAGVLPRGIHIAIKVPAASSRDLEKLIDYATNRLHELDKQEFMRESITFSGIQFNMVSLPDTKINLQPDIKKIDAPNKGQLVLDFMTEIARLIGKEVLLVAEKSDEPGAQSGTPVYCIVSPTTRDIQFKAPLGWTIQ